MKSQFRRNYEGTASLMKHGSEIEWGTVLSSRLGPQYCNCIHLRPVGWL